MDIGEEQREIIVVPIEVPRTADPVPVDEPAAPAPEMEPAGV